MKSPPDHNYITKKIRKTKNYSTNNINIIVKSAIIFLIKWSYYACCDIMLHMYFCETWCPCYTVSIMPTCNLQS